MRIIESDQPYPIAVIIENEEELAYITHMFNTSGLEVKRRFGSGDGLIPKEWEHAIDSSNVTSDRWKMFYHLCVTRGIAGK